MGARRTPDGTWRPGVHHDLTPVRRLLSYFFRGLIFLAPVAITIWVCVWLFREIDGWLQIPIPGIGFVLTIVLITAFGFLASNLFARGLIGTLEAVLNKVPFVRLVYSSTRDLVKAFVGEKRSFDKPVLVQLFAGGHARAFGFVTKESLEQLGHSEFVTVYMPQSYHFAGQLYVFPSAVVERLDTSSADVMAFIVSGGVTDVPAIDHQGKAVAAAAAPPSHVAG
jgi:uncharacterized membrane protein